jgi:N utilization substance protein A
MSVKLETKDIRTMATFEKITRVHPKDCIITEDHVYFLVEPEKIGFAIGKGGSVIKEVRKVLGKPVKLFGYHDSPEEFIRGVAPNVKTFEKKNDVISVSLPTKDKVVLIGRNGNNIKAVKTMLERHFQIKNFRVR